jgi:hypothetical protein
MRFKLFFCIFTALMLISEFGFALQAIIVKGNRVLFSIDSGESASLSTNTLVISTDKSTQVKLIQVSGPRAVGQVVKGTAKVNMIFRPLRGDNKKNDLRFGFLAGLSLNTMTIQLSSSNTLKLQGTSFNLMGLIDFPLFANFTLRGLAGYEKFQASVPSTTCPSETCAVTLNYLSGEGFAQYDVARFGGGSRFWLGLGAGVLMSISGESEIINVNSMKTNQIFILATGADIRLSNTTTIPVQVDYFLYPDGDIKTQQINFRLGYKF